eukprot:6138770-Alexandrium_andersonii.AAC.1
MYPYVVFLARVQRRRFCRKTSDAGRPDAVLLASAQKRLRSEMSAACGAGGASAAGYDAGSNSLSRAAGGA